MIGLRLAQYLIDAELGRGGMGIVYRATDTKLERTVALKVLPAAALASEDDRARFYREARAAAALNHPNIAAVHQIDEAIAVDGDGKEVEASDGPRPFIAMEFIEGGTLGDRIGKGPLKLDEAVRIASQVGDALRVAHAKGIVHRDIKSANIMLTAEGQAKVLDFGLAKTTHSTLLTRQGSTLGTVAYMSPEQARGEEADGRSDLYSLGSVLYEMICGRLPFAGEYEQAVVYSILNTPPEPLTALRTGVPMELERITLKLLAKDAARRYQTAADLIADLGGLDMSASASAVRTPSQAMAAAAPVDSRRPVWQTALAGLALLLLGALGSWLLKPAAPEPPVERLMLDMGAMRAITSVGISPDSRFIAMTGYDWDGNEGLFLYRLEDGSITHVERSEGAYYPWFSPSGDRVAFQRESDHSTYVMDVPSGTPSKVIDNAWTSYWLDEDRLLYTVERWGQDDVRGPNYIYSLSRDSSTVVRGTERAIDGPVWFFPGPRIPGSDLAVGNQQGRSSFGLDPRLYVVDLEEGAIEETDYPGINVQPLSEDILIYQLGDDAGKIVARRFDPSSKRFTSPPVDLLEDTFFATFQAEPVSGSLVFVPDHLPNRQLVSVLDLGNRTLSEYDIAGERSQIYQIVLTRDGTTLIGSSIDGETGRSRVVTVDLATDQTTVRREGATEIGVDMLPGDRLLSLEYELASGQVRSTMQLVARPLRGAGRTDTLSAPFADLTYAGALDEGYVVAVGGDLGLLDRDGQAFTPWVASGWYPNVSSDGRYIAYQTQVGLMAVYDRIDDSVTELTGLRGSNPQWSDDGRYLYFLSLEGLPDTWQPKEAEVVRLPVRLSGGFEITGDPEFVLHVRSPVQLSVGRGRLAVHSGAEVSLERPGRSSVRVAWWRHVAREVDRALAR